MLNTIYPDQGRIYGTYLDNLKHCKLFKSINFNLVVGEHTTRYYM